MNTFISMTAGAALAVLGSTGFAATIDTTGYTISNLEASAGYAIYDNDNGSFIAETFDFAIYLDAFLPFTNTDASVDYVGFIDILDSIEVAVMTEKVQFLFEDGPTRYLLTVDAAGGGADFLDTGGLAFYDVDAQITLDQLDPDNANIVPLPAGLVLLLTGIGGLAAMRRKSS